MERIGLSLRYLLLLALLSALFACGHRELSDPLDSHYVRLYLDEEIKNVTCGFYNENCEKPEYVRPMSMRVILADPQTGEVVSERILRGQGKDAKGYYIDGHIAAPAGTYNILFHSVGSSVTNIGNEDDYYGIYAFTNPIGEYYLQYLPGTKQEFSKKRIVNQPDLLFHDVQEQITLQKSKTVDTIKRNDGEYFVAHSMVLTYYLQIKVHGIEWVKSAASLISGMAGSSMLNGHGVLIETDPVHLFFSMKYIDKKRESDASGAVLYATFNTFGKLPDATTIYTLNMEFIRSDGSSQVEQIDITPMFDTPMVMENRWIILDHEIVVDPPDGTGGMMPGVEGWKDIEADVEI